MSRTVPRTALVALMIWGGTAAVERTAASAESAAALTTDIAVACPTEAGFERYATLVTEDVSAAISYAADHGCISVPPGTVVRIDQGSTVREFSHVCVRPVGSYDCFWTFAAHIKATAP